MQKTLIDEFEHHCAQARRVLRSAADELNRDHHNFTREEAQEWNSITEVYNALNEQRNHIVELMPDPFVKP